MNRLEELQQLKLQKQNIPSLDHIVNQEVKHYYRYQRRKKYFYQPCVALLSLILMTTLIMNIFPHTAYACKNIPIMNTIAKSLCFNQTVKDCIDNDYAVYVHQTRGSQIPITLEYYIIDETQITLFFSMESQYLEISDFQFFDESKKNYNSLNFSYDEDSIIINCTYNDIQQIEFLPKLSFRMGEERYTFDLSIQKNQIKKAKTIELNKELVVHNQKLTIRKLEVYPSVTKIFIESDPQNTLKFEKADITLMSHQTAYTNVANGISAESIGNNHTLMIESPYFKGDFTLTIHKVYFTDPQYDHCEIDVDNKTIHNLPKEIEVKNFEVSKDKLSITIQTLKPQNTNYELVTQYDENNQLKNINTKKFGSRDNKMYHDITIPYHSQNTYALDIDYQQSYDCQLSMKIEKKSLK